ncbi:MAG TPA: hypothetical protein DIU01_01085 [Flavobacterium sp.]|nr:hypothetical protein [Flavobacterium sp.]
MLLIFISWLYIFFTSINLGFCTNKIVGIKNQNFVITSFLGLLSTTLFASIWAIFGRINIEFHSVLLILNLIIFFKFNSEIKLIYNSFYQEFKNLNATLKFFFAAITTLIIAQCSSIPYVIDNESYYIQTIKWLNEYGFVKGLGNLHIFYAQTSGWHIAQSAFNFSFLYKNFNDLSGFCLLLGNIFAIFKLNEYFSTTNKNYLIIGLLPLANVFFFQFISAPSPDIPIYILTFIIFFYFIENFKNTTIDDFNLITLLVLFALFIKVTSVALLILPIILLITNFKSFAPKLLPIISFGLLFLSLFIIKNSLLTGYPLFPFTRLELDSNHIIPRNVISFFFSEQMRYNYFISESDLNQLSFSQIAIKWLLSSKINAIFNALTILIVAISPFFIFKYFNKKSVWIIYFVILFQLLILLFTSPQYRFFIHLTLFYSFFIFACWFANKKLIFASYYLSIGLIAVVLFFPISYKSLTENKLIGKNSRFSATNILYPHNNSKWTTTFDSVQKGNLKFNSPTNNYFFWGSGNGNLPSVNKVQIEYFEKYYQVLPQQTTTDLKDGFYAKKLSSNE